MSATEKIACTVRDGKFVEPCDTLREMSEGRVALGKSRGLHWWDLTNLETGKPSRTFWGMKTSAMPKGIVINFCPWCGTRIDAPALGGEEPKP